MTISEMIVNFLGLPLVQNILALALIALLLAQVWLKIHAAHREAVERQRRANRTGIEKQTDYLPPWLWIIIGCVVANIFAGVLWQMSASDQDFTNFADRLRPFVRDHRSFLVAAVFILAAVHAGRQRA